MTAPEAATGPPEGTSLFWIDALRVAGAIAVVFLHVAAEPVVLVKDRSSAAWWTGNLIDSAMRWCVPIFVMLSGALLLAPRAESTREFFVRRVRRIAIPVVAWSAAYIGFRAVRQGMPGWEWIGDRILAGRPEYHLWYVYMTLGLYLLTPLLRRFTARTDRRQLGAACIVLMSAAALHDALYSFGYAPPLASVFSMYLPFLGYYLTGFALVQHTPRFPSGLLVGGAAACAFAIALGIRPSLDRYGVSPAGLYLYEYLAPPVIGMSLAVFLLGSRIPTPDPTRLAARLVRDLSAATLGIYLIHPMWIRLLRDQGLAVRPLGVLGVPIVASVALLLSYAAVSVLRRTPLLRQTV